MHLNTKVHRPQNWTKSKLNTKCNALELDSKRTQPKNHKAITAETMCKSRGNYGAVLL
jgi:hypothetical protein